MKKLFTFLSNPRKLSPKQTTFSISSTNPHNRIIIAKRGLSTFSDEPELKEFNDYMDNLKNYEKSGVPRNAGTDSDDGFDLGRMNRLMDRLGNPHFKFKAVHIAGTKGKGSTAAFLSNILRTEGYSIGCYTSPHIRTIRERICVGELGEPVSTKTLTCLFHKVRKIVDSAMEHENGHLSHFEVMTAMAFTLFAQENVDIAVIEAGLGGARDATNIISSSGLALSLVTTISEEHLAALGGSLESIAMAKSGIIKHRRPVVLGGPFLPHIERLLRDKASLMCSPVVSASGPANRSILKGLNICDGKPRQCCDITINVERDFPLSIELCDVNLSMLGSHQLQNAATATCAALCLRDKGWMVEDKSIRVGLESTYLLGRSQFLTSKEVEGLGLPGTTILLDGAHTKDSAKALAQTIRMTFPEARLGLVIAMASDKDHLAFARELLSGGRIEVVVLTEADIAGGKSRIASVSSLQESWLQASKELGIDVLHDEMSEYETVLNDNSVSSAGVLKRRSVLVCERSLPVSMKIVNQILEARTEDRSAIIVVTGSLHIVSSVLASIQS